MGPVWAIVVAGGSGSRFGGPKQFADLNGRSVVSRSVTACRSVAERVVLVLPADRLEDDHGADLVVTGGLTRSDSVRRGLAAVPGGIEIVVVHDGARPLAMPTLFAAVVSAVSAGAGAAVSAVPVSDTVKQVSQTAAPGLASNLAAREVVGTIDRQSLVSVQTPQAFRTSILRRAHREELEATDDAALVERLGALVVTVPGDRRNLKLTEPRDLDVASFLLAPTA